MSDENKNTSNEVCPICGGRLALVFEHELASDSDTFSLSVRMDCASDDCLFDFELGLSSNYIDNKDMNMGQLSASRRGTFVYEIELE